MNISERGIQLDNKSYSTNQPVSVRGQDSTRVQTNTVNNQLAAVPEGEIFQGKILDITNNQVKIALDANNIIQARMAEALTLNIGDELSFLVKENNGQSVFIKPLDNMADTMKNSALSKIIEQNNLSPSEKNYQIAEGLMNHNMPLDRNSMQKILQQSYKYPDAAIDDLINMNKLGIPVNKGTIQQYQDMLNNHHQLSGNISEFSQSVAAFAGSMADDFLLGSIDEDTFSNNINKLLNIISDDADAASADFLAELDGGVNDQTILSKASTEHMSAELKNDSAVNGNKLSNDLTGASETMDASEQTLANNKSLADELSQKLGLDKGKLEGVLNKLSEAGVSDKILESMSQKSDTPMQLLNNLKELINHLPTDNKDMLAAELMKSKDLQGLLSGAIAKKFSLNTDKMENPKELSDLYKSIYEKTEKLINTFSDSSGSFSEHMKDSGRSMQERMDFVQNLNELYGYTQMPVTISGKDMNSELYVYMNKNARKDLSKEVSALLHLDMNALGATDVHVSLSGSTVHTRFYVDDEISARIIDEHMNILEQAINSVGYSLTNEVVARDVKLSSTSNKVVEEVLGKDLEQSIRRYSFDVKM